MFDKVQRAVDFNRRNKGVENAEHFKKETLEEKVQKVFVQLLSKDKNNADQWFSVCRKNRKSQKRLNLNSKQ